MTFESHSGGMRRTPNASRRRCQHRYLAKPLECAASPRFCPAPHRLPAARESGAELAPLFAQPPPLYAPHPEHLHSGGMRRTPNASRPRTPISRRNMSPDLRFNLLGGTGEITQGVYGDLAAARGHIVASEAASGPEHLDFGGWFRTTQYLHETVLGPIA